MKKGGIFEVKDIIRTLPEWINVTAIFQNKDNSLIKIRCFFIGKVNEIVFDPTERVLNSFISPVELIEGEFEAPQSASNFIDFEINYTLKEVKGERCPK